MTILTYSTALETAASPFETFKYGYSWEINLNHKEAYPVLRAYPEKWGLPRTESFKLDQEFWIYNIAADIVTSWDEALVLWAAFAANLPTNISLNQVNSVDLYPLGKTVEYGQAIKIVANLTIWC